MKKSNPMRTIQGGKPAAAKRRGASTTAKRTARSRGEKTVRDVMVSNVVTIGLQDSLAEAARTMAEANIGMLPVVENERVHGVITDRDIVVRAIAREADPAATRVGECLTASVICAHPEWTAEEAMEAMGDAQIGRLPVVDEEDRLVGVVTLSSMALRARDKEETLETAQEVSRRSARISAG
jgi:CBS domain-containing protein